MASHYKVFINNSDSNNFCFMPTLNTSTFGYINHTLKYPQLAPLSDYSNGSWPAVAVNILLCFLGMTLNGLIGIVSIKDKVLRSENITPAIVSLVGTNFLFCLIGLFAAFSISSDVTFRIQIECKLWGSLLYGLMLCSIFNILGVGICKFFRLYFLTTMNEEIFRRTCIFAAGLAWIVSFVVSLPTAIGLWGQLSVECNSRLCAIINVNADGSNTGYSVATIYYSSYIAVGILNILLNIAIYYKIRNFIKTKVSDIGNLSAVMTMNYVKKERKAVKIMGTDSALYAIFPIPRAVLFILEPYLKTTVYWAYKASFTTWGLTAIIEPLLLLTFQEKYRTEIKKILKVIYSSTKN